MKPNSSSAYVTCLLGGILVPCIYFTCFFISLSLFPPPFSPFQNMISDLGNSSYNPSGAAWFNVGNILTGLCVVPFVFGFRIWYHDQKELVFRVKLLQLGGFVHAFAIIMVGIFSEDYGATHIIWALTYFATNISFVIFSFLAFRKHPRFPQWIPVYCLIVIFLNLVNIFSFGLTPIVEWIAVHLVTGLELILLGNTVRVFRQVSGSSKDLS